MFGGYPPTAIGYPPTAIGYTPTAIGYPPTAISYPPAAIIGRIGHSEFFFYFLLWQPLGRGEGLWGWTPHVATEISQGIRREVSVDSGQRMKYLSCGDCRTSRFSGCGQQEMPPAGQPTDGRGRDKRILVSVYHGTVYRMAVQRASGGSQQPSTCVNMVARIRIHPHPHRTLQGGYAGGYAAEFAPIPHDDEELAVVDFTGQNKPRHKQSGSVLWVRNAYVTVVSVCTDGPGHNRTHPQRQPVLWYNR